MTTNRKITSIPIELIHYKCRFLEIADIYRFSSTCTLFKNQLSEYKLNRRSIRLSSQEKMKLPNPSVKVYPGPDGAKPYGLARYKNLLIGVSNQKIWAWDIDSSTMIWVYHRPSEKNDPNYYLGDHSRKIYIENGKVICPVIKLNNGSYYYKAYIVILDAETGRLQQLYCDNSTWGDETQLLDQLTLASGGQIIVKQMGGDILCYDTEFNLQSTYKSSLSYYEYSILLATPNYIIDVNESQIAIWDRSTGRCKIINCEWGPAGGLDWRIHSAYVEGDRLVCGAAREEHCKGGDPDFIILDLVTGEVIERYCSKGNIFNNEAIESITMKGNDIFYICHRKLYWSSLKTRTPTFLEDATPNDYLAIHDNYLFVSHAQLYPGGSCDLTIWDIDTKMKVATIKDSLIKDALWESGYLFTNTRNFLVRYDFNPNLTEINIARAKL